MRTFEITCYDSQADVLDKRTIEAVNFSEVVLKVGDYLPELEDKATILEVHILEYFDIEDGEDEEEDEVEGE